MWVWFDKNTRGILHRSAAKFTVTPLAGEGVLELPDASVAGELEGKRLTAALDGIEDDPAFADLNGSKVSSAEKVDEITRARIATEFPPATERRRIADAVSAMAASEPIPADFVNMEARKNVIRGEGADVKTIKGW